MDSKFLGQPEHRPLPLEFDLGLKLLGERDLSAGPTELPNGLCQLSRHAGEASHVNCSDRVYAAAIISINWENRS
jgi:hypothetical protein